MRTTSTQKSLGENAFHSVTVVERLKSRNDDFIAKSEHRVFRGTTVRRSSSFSLSTRGRYRVFGASSIAAMAALTNVRHLEGALDKLLGLRPLQVADILDHLSK